MGSRFRVSEFSIRWCVNWFLVITKSKPPRTLFWSNLNPLFLIQLHSQTTSLFKYGTDEMFDPILTIYFRLHKQVLSMIHLPLPEHCPRLTPSTWRDWLKSIFTIKTLPWLTMVPAKVCQNCHKQEAEDGISCQNSKKTNSNLFIEMLYFQKP